MKNSAFGALCGRVAACYRCRRMDWVHVLGAANGPVSARVLMVGEAPGRRGAARTGVPFSGDASGRRFERLLVAAGLRREQVFITNAVLCNPLDGSAEPSGRASGRGLVEGGSRNRRPSMSEVSNCGEFLAEQIRLVDPVVVVALGQVALAALRRHSLHRLSLGRDAGRAHPWDNRLLVPLYHPGPRAAVHRSMDQQEQDWRRLGWLVRRLERVPGDARRGAGDRDIAPSFVSHVAPPASQRPATSNG